MSYIVTIDSESTQALGLIKYLKSLDFVKVKKEKKVVKKTEILEEDEDGIPIKYRDEIMAMSKQAKQNMARKWREDLAKKGEV